MALMERVLPDPKTVLFRNSFLTVTKKIRKTIEKNPICGQPHKASTIRPPQPGNFEHPTYGFHRAEHGQRQPHQKKKQRNNKSLRVLFSVSTICLPACLSSTHV